MNEPTLHGSCLCGAVKYEVTPPFRFFAHCHCSRCRKASGTGHATNIAVAPEQFRWLAGEAAINRYKHPEAESFGKWFCNNCGAPVPRSTRNDTLIVIPAGSLDDEPSAKPTDRIFWGSRAAWSCNCDDMPRHEEYPEAWFPAPKNENDE